MILPGEAANPADLPSGCHFHPRCQYAEDRCRTEEPTPDRSQTRSLGQLSLCGRTGIDRRRCVADPRHGTRRGRLPGLCGSVHPGGGPGDSHGRASHGGAHQCHDTVPPKSFWTPNGFRPNGLEHAPAAPDSPPALGAAPEASCDTQDPQVAYLHATHAMHFRCRIAGISHGGTGPDPRPMDDQHSGPDCSAAPWRVDAPPSHSIAAGMSRPALCQPLPDHGPP